MEELKAQGKQQMEVLKAQNKQQMEELKAQRKALKRALDPIKEMVFSMVFAPRTMSSNSSKYWKSAAEYYTGSPTPSRIICAVSGVRLPACDVRAGHIYQEQWWCPKGTLGFKTHDPWNIHLADAHEY
ncbi:hypothetical protein Vafri_10579 [Volvox africanus]|uniref:Uncharacterized protein n=1 Tax=Volvox africanus TaxID=51714 RepID=A0A8J4B6V4_9CHLO|nr:hypothetical protein Vafri_10579 [Volvox africanus]